MPKPTDKQQLESQRLQDRFLALTLMQPPLRDSLGPITGDMLYTDQGRALLKFLQEHLDFTGQPEKVSELKDLSDYVKIESLLYEELYQGLEIHELQYEAARLQARLIEQYVKSQKLILAIQLQDSDASETDELLLKAKHLDELLRLTRRP